MAVPHNPRVQKLVLVVIIAIILSFVWPRRTQYIFTRPSFTISHNTSSSETSDKVFKKPSNPHQPPLNRLQGWFNDAISKPKQHGSSIKPIAYIFPAFHPFPENDKIWGANFTEWDNVRKLTHNKWGLELIRPSTEIGYYNGVEFDTRKRQGRYLLDSGFYGAAFHHYWFSGKPVMDGVLKGILNDGEPNIPFMLSWANEPWTSRWNGATGEVYLAQDYGDVEDWRAHFDWLLPFFRHPKYIRSEGRVQFVVYSILNMGMVANRMFPAWRQWAIEEGLGGLDIIETRYSWSPRDEGKAPPDAMNEFQPHAAGNWLHGGYQSQKRTSRIYHRGTLVCWDSTPRHATDGLAPINPLCHPTNWQYHLVEIFRKIKSDPNPLGSENFFFVNALNEWGEGCALEPSIQFDDGYGKAMKNALEISEKIHHWSDELVTNGLQRGKHEKGKKFKSSDVCVVVRTTSAQREIAIFNLGTMLASLQAQENQDWNALVVQTDQAPFDGFEELVLGPLDSRIRLAVVPEGSFSDAVDGGDYASKVTDWAIEELSTLHHSCASAKYLLISDGKDTYEPNAFDVVSQTQGDLIGLNYESYRTIWNEVINTERCISLQREPIHMYEPTQSLCSHASKHAKGGIPLGSLFLNLTRFKTESHKLATFPAGQPLNQDDALVDSLRARNDWEWSQSTSESTDFMENPTYTSCVRTGNFWLDSPLQHERGCYGTAELQSRYGEDYNRWDLQYFRENGGCLRFKPGTV